MLLNEPAIAEWMVMQDKNEKQAIHKLRMNEMND